MPVKIGRFWRGTEWARMMRAPAKIPEPPAPATARPTMRLVLLGETPHNSEPSSKMLMATRKVYLIEKKV
jgi:hypothetical protein